MISDDTADDNTEISGERGGAGATVVPARLVSSVSQLLESDGISVVFVDEKRLGSIRSARDSSQRCEYRFKCIDGDEGSNSDK